MEPTLTELQQAYQREQARRAYFNNYQKARRNTEEGAQALRKNSRVYYWAHRETILAKRAAKASQQETNNP